MGVWTQISGTATIPKKHRISVETLARKHFGDEGELKVFPQSSGENWIQHMEGYFSLDGAQFIKAWPKFEEELKAVEKDLNITTRFL